MNFTFLLYDVTAYLTYPNFVIDFFFSEIMIALRIQILVLTTSVGPLSAAIFSLTRICSLFPFYDKLNRLKR